MKRCTHPGLINTSYFVLFLITSGLLSRGLVLPFHIYGEVTSWIIVYLYAVLLYFVWHWLRQFADEDHIFIYLILSLMLFPLLTGVILNNLFGALQPGTVPILHGVGVFGWRTLLVEATPSVYLNYGALAYAFGLLLAIPLDIAYDRFSKLLPQSIRYKFKSLDGAIDRHSTNFTDAYFHFTDRGFLIGISTLLIFLMLNTLVLVLHK